MDVLEVIRSDAGMGVGYVLMHSVWEGAAICLAAGVGLWVLRRGSAASRYGVAAGAMGLMLAAPLITFFVLMGMGGAGVAEGMGKAALPLGKLVKTVPAISTSASIVTAKRVNGGVGVPVAEMGNRNASGGSGIVDRAEAESASRGALERLRMERWLSYAVMTWVVGVIGLSLWRIGGWIALQRLRVVGVGSVPRSVMAAFERVKRPLGIRRAVRLVTSVRVDAPMVLGVLKPLILMPPALLAGLSMGQVEAILAHELAHVRRHDYLALLLQTVVETLLFYHPGVWWLARRIRLEREQCCDDIAAAACGDRRGYAGALAAIEEIRMATPLALAAGGSNARELMMRIGRLVGVEAPRRPRRRQAAGVAMVLVIALLVAAAALAGRQAKGQEAGQTVVVRLTDAATGQGVPAAILKMHVGNDEYNGATDDSGNAKLEVDLSQASRVVIYTTAGGWVPIRLDWTRQKNGEKAPAQFDIVTDRTTTIGGMVVDQEGNAVTDARLMFQMDKKYAGHPWQRPNILFTTVYANDKGVWSLDQAPAQFDQLRLAVFNPECLGEDGIYDLKPFTDVASLHARTAKIMAQRGTPVNVEVRGPDNKPVAGARIAYGADRVASNVYPEIQADRDGKAALGIKPGVEAFLTIHAPGCGFEFKRFTVGKEPMEMVVNLGLPQVLSGRVVDPDGNGVSEGTVIFDTWQGMRPFEKRIATDGDGKFEWAEAPKGEILVDVFGKGMAVKRGVKMEAGKDNVVTLLPPTVFKGSVVDAETGLPVKDYEVYFGMASGRSTDASWMPQVQAAPPSDKEGTFEFKFTEYEKRAIRISAPGYLPSDSPLFPVDGHEVSFVFKLVKGQDQVGTVVDSEGKPLAGVKVYVLGPRQSLQIDDGRVPSPTVKSCITKEDGTFTLSASRDPYLLVVTEKDGFVEVKQAEFEKENRIVLQKWGRAEGVAMEGKKPLAEAKLMLEYQNMRTANQISVLALDRPVTDAEGKFVLEHVIPNEGFRIGILREIKEGSMAMISSERNTSVLTAKAGETVHVQVGGGGRNIIGKVEVPAEVTGDFEVESFAQIEAVFPPLDWVMPVEMMEKSDEDRQKWSSDFRNSEAGRRLTVQQIEQQGASPVSMFASVLQPDGTIRVPDTKPGRYRITVRVRKKSKPTADDRGLAALLLVQNASSVLGVASCDLIVPELTNGNDTAVDLGTIRVEAAKEVQVGDIVPEMQWTTFDGKVVGLSALKGKVVVLEMWTTAGVKYLPEADAMNALWKQVAADNRVAMVSLCRASRNNYGDARRYVAAKNFSWPVGYFDDGIQYLKSNALMPLGPQSEVWVIGADGKLLARGLRGDDVKAAVERALAK